MNSERKKRVTIDFLVNRQCGQHIPIRKKFRNLLENVDTIPGNLSNTGKLCLFIKTSCQFLCEFRRRRTSRCLNKEIFGTIFKSVSRKTVS